MPWKVQQATTPFSLTIPINNRACLEREIYVFACLGVGKGRYCLWVECLCFLLSLPLLWWGKAAMGWWKKAKPRTAIRCLLLHLDRIRWMNLLRQHLLHRHRKINLHHLQPALCITCLLLLNIFPSSKSLLLRFPATKREKNPSARTG